MNGPWQTVPHRSIALESDTWGPQCAVTLTLSENSKGTRTPISIIAVRLRTGIEIHGLKIPRRAARKGDPSGRPSGAFSPNRWEYGHRTTPPFGASRLVGTSSTIESLIPLKYQQRDLIGIGIKLHPNPVR